jgi:hypothetical protein
VIDLFGGQMLARLIRVHVPDDPNLHQLSNDMIPLGIRIRIGGMGNLECELR